VIESKTTELAEAAWTEMNDIVDRGGAFECVEELKGRLVTSMAERTRRIEAGEQVVVGVNRFTETADSPLGGTDNILTVDPRVEAETINEVNAWRAARNQSEVDTACANLRLAVAGGTNVMEASIALARAGGTTGEWADVLRDVVGEYRAPTGIAAAAGRRVGEMAAVAKVVKAITGGPPKLLMAKPGLDGHSSGAEQIAVAARDAGFEVVYAGIRLTPRQIAASARDEDPDVIGLSILSGSHMQLIPDVIAELHAMQVDAPVVVGGIIPESDRDRLLREGVAAVYTPKDFAIAQIIGDIATLAASHRAR
jgi:(2R)-ethylmalonyl-CoA mutase